MEQEKQRRETETKATSEPEENKEGQESTIDALEDVLGTGKDAATVLFSIVVSALQSPETFGADDVMLTLQSFGMENVIDEARVFYAGMEEGGDVGDPAEDTDIDAMLEDLG